MAGDNAGLIESAATAVLGGTTIDAPLNDLAAVLPDALDAAWRRLIALNPPLTDDPAPVSLLIGLARTILPACDGAALRVRLAPMFGGGGLLAYRPRERGAAEVARDSVSDQLTVTIGTPEWPEIGTLSVVSGGPVPVEAQPIVDAAARYLGLRLTRMWTPAEGLTLDRVPRLQKVDAFPEHDASAHARTRIVTVARDVLDAERALLWQADAARTELWASVDGRDGSRFELRMPLKDGLAGGVLADNQPLIMSDPYQDGRFHPVLDWRLGRRTREVLLVPVRAANGEPVGVLEVNNRQSGGFFTEADQVRLSAFADQLGVMLENERLMTEILAEKTHNDSIMRSLSNGVMTVDATGIVNYANDAVARILKRENDVLVGRALSALFTDFDAWLPDAVEQVAHSLEEKMLPSVEFYDPAEDTWIPVNLSIVPLSDGRGNMLGFMLLFEDTSRERELRRTMARYLPSDVVDKLVAPAEKVMKGVTQQVTVLSSGIRSFAQLSTQVGPADAVALLNDYFTHMEGVVGTHAGIIDSYNGDTLRALFGAPFPTGDDGQNAIDAGIDMFVMLETINRLRQEAGKPAIDVGVGIGTGEVIAGTVGSPSRMDFTVIGGACSLSLKLERFTKAYKANLLVCGTSFAALKRPVLSRLVDRQRLTMTEVLDIHQILQIPGHGGLGDAVETAIARYAEAMDLYLAADWPKAEEAFRAYVDDFPGDATARAMLDRVKLWPRHPDMVWDGATDTGAFPFG